jgi:hypothetical protein
MLRSVLAFGLLLCSYTQALAAQNNALRDAFTAAFGKNPAPRHAIFPDGTKLTYRLAPIRLVPIGGTRFALIASETANAAHADTGAAAVAYLDHASGSWKLIRSWYEFIQDGSFGTPFIGNMAFTFGAIPIFVGEGNYCGMGACTTWYSLIGLTPAGPVSWGDIQESGSLEAVVYDDLADSEGQTGCGGYNYTSRISAPRTKGDIMRVTYKGWMLPGGGGQKRQAVIGSTEVSLRNGKLALHPAIAIPTCGQ